MVLRRDEASSILLSVRDNGVGMPRDLNLNNLESFGLTLVKTLVDDLEGTIEFDTGHGTEVTVRFQAG